MKADTEGYRTYPPDQVRLIPDGARVSERGSCSASATTFLIGGRRAAGNDNQHQGKRPVLRGADWLSGNVEDAPPRATD